MCGFFLHNFTLILCSLGKTVDYCQIKGVPFSLSLGKLHSTQLKGNEALCDPALGEASKFPLHLCI